MAACPTIQPKGDVMPEKTKVHAEEKLELAKAFPHRVEMIRDFLMCYQPLCVRRLVKAQGMRHLVEQFHADLLVVAEDFNGNFPAAIGEVEERDDTEEATVTPISGVTESGAEEPGAGEGAGDGA